MPHLPGFIWKGRIPRHHNAEYRQHCRLRQVEGVAAVAAVAGAAAAVAAVAGVGVAAAAVVARNRKGLQCNQAEGAAHRCSLLGAEVPRVHGAAPKLTRRPANMLQADAAFVANSRLAASIMGMLKRSLADGDLNTTQESAAWYADSRRDRARQDLRRARLLPR